MDFASLSEFQRNKLACSLATMLLHDAEMELSSDNLKEVVSKSGLQVPDYWFQIFESNLKQIEVKDYL